MSWDKWRQILTCDEYLAMMRSIREMPDDDLRRLVLADWLEDQGDQHYCHFIRQQCTGTVKKKVDANGPPTQAEVDEAYIRRVYIEAVCPVLAGSYKLSRGFISEVSISFADWWGSATNSGHPEWTIYEFLRITQPPFTVVIEPTQPSHYGPNGWRERYGLHPHNAGKYLPSLSVIQEEERLGTIVKLMSDRAKSFWDNNYQIFGHHQYDNSYKVAYVSPIAKWCVGEHRPSVDESE